METVKDLHSFKIGNYLDDFCDYSKHPKGKLTNDEAVKRAFRRVELETRHYLETKAGFCFYRAAVNQLSRILEKIREENNRLGKVA